MVDAAAVLRRRHGVLVLHLAGHRLARGGLASARGVTAGRPPGPKADGRPACGAPQESPPETMSPESGVIAAAICPMVSKDTPAPVSAGPAAGSAFRVAS